MPTDLPLPYIWVHHPVSLFSLRVIKTWFVGSFQVFLLLLISHTLRVSLWPDRALVLRSPTPTRPITSLLRSSTESGEEAIFQKFRKKLSHSSLKFPEILTKNLHGKERDPGKGYKMAKLLAPTFFTSTWIFASFHVVIITGKQFFKVIIWKYLFDKEPDWFYFTARQKIKTHNFDSTTLVQCLWRSMKKEQT